MRILLSNDDGIEAQGINILAEELKNIANVIVVAPDRDRSGASNSLTLDTPVRVKRVQGNAFRVAGTPTDCVHLALTGLLDEDPDMVISGINHGANMGDDVIYSGTVAAAMEGRTLGRTAIAISLVVDDRPHYFDTAARVARRLIDHLLGDPLPHDTVLNVNVPDCPYDELQGFAITRLGNRHRAGAMVREKDPRGRPVYWIGPPGPAGDAGPGTDFHALAHGKVSITPIHADLTRHAALEHLSKWMSD